ncbi:hypothetical protein SDC9_184052 [bioreactor metagenome]|uniref:Uncharacterized protein n=1 Tax=bioreactor metagenome TaxID=1076179 RepID=A0A645HLN4_9ZZZZ
MERQAGRRADPGRGNDLQGAEHPVPNLRGELHRGGMVRHLPRREGLRPVLRRGTGTLGDCGGQEGFRSLRCGGRDRNARRSHDRGTADRAFEYDPDGNYLCGCG